MNRRILCLWLICPLFGCARPELPAADVAQPDRVVPVESNPEPEPEPSPAPEPAPVPEPEPGVTLTIESPATGQVFAPGEPVEVRLAFTNGESDGAVILIDHGAPRLVAPGSTALIVGALPQGPHVIRAVALDATGLSLGESSLAMVICQVGEGASAPSGFDPSGAMVTVAQPYGEVALAESGEVPFDVRVDQAMIGESGAKLKWQVDSEEVEWLAEYPPAEPLSLGRLETGKHRLRVWLESAAGVPLSNGGYERADREFTVPAAGGAG